MNYTQLKQQNKYVLLDCVSGSQAYNLALPTSDIDKKGVFILPQKEFYGFDLTDQVANATNDEVYYELKRFIDLLTKNNPNILELLNTPKDQILYTHPLIDLIKPGDFLSKLCFDTFAGYAQTQIKKAKGLNKKINKPMPVKQKSVQDFCFVIYKNGSIPINIWLIENGLLQENCGLTNLEHFRNVYLLYGNKNPTKGFKGIVSGPNADDVQLSSIPKGMEPLATMNFNKDSYSIYCREYREYKEWEANRNQSRYESTIAHGKSYDAKNMMHTFRLLNMAEEIALYHEVRVHREDRSFLLNIRQGIFEFDTLMQMVNDKSEQVKKAFDKSDLPEMPDIKKAENLLVQIREEFYKH
jgi:hypothetical protein